ncbi:hypothetical protein VE23_03895 [Paenibacillus sp. D9]|uniref:hypothetical protein n=1 Tax=Paenibacillus TaxID=44249 RepID=UPI0006201477|nr:MULTISPECIES: hypothetical protein [Paenibacillus]KKC46449.1 hypothetical protein VE23_03895 [Paenibacillus sp. D9]
MKRKKRIAGMMIAASSLLFSGCTADMSGRDANGFIPHLSVDMKVPTDLKLGMDKTFSIQVEENGKPYEGFYKAQFQFWPEDGSSPPLTVPGVMSSPGCYTASPAFDKEGVYRVKFSGISAEYEIMPAKRFAIGAQASKHLTELEKQENDAPSTPAAGGHHHGQKEFRTRSWKERTQS